MVLTNEQKRVRDLLTETVTLLCKNGLQFKSEIGIEALIGITLDRDEVFLVSIKETISSTEESSNGSLLSLGSIGKAVDDAEFVATTDIFKSNGTKTQKRPAQPAGKVRRTRRNSRSRPEANEKLSVLKSETVVDEKEIAKSETLEQAGIVRTHQHSKSRRCSYTIQPSEIEILNSFTIAAAAADRTAKFGNESTDLVELAMEAQNSNDSCIIEIKQENVEEEYNPYTEFDSLCANSIDELNGVDLKPDNERPGLSHGSSRDQLFPLQRRRGQNVKLNQNNAAAKNAGAGKTAESDAHRCPICGSVSPDWNVYLRHIRKHQPGLYRCPFCGKSFSGSTNLRGHLAVHTNVREFACHLCEKDYAYKKDLTEHLILKHGHIVSRTSLAAPSGSTGRLSIEKL